MLARAHALGPRLYCLFLPCRRLRAPLCLLLALVFALLLLLALVSVAGTPQVRGLLLATGGIRIDAGAGANANTSASASQPQPQPRPKQQQQLASANSSLLYECEISYVQMDVSLIKFSINYLDLADEPRAALQLPEIDQEASPCALSALARLDPARPFVFFINGFNTFGPTHELNASWMYEVAKSFARRPPASYEDHHDDYHELTPAPAPASAPRNVVFLTWSIPNLFASNLLAMIPAYYKTVANYDLIAGSVARALAKLVAFVDGARAFATARERAAHFRRWHFYGHSLGSHILSEAIVRVASARAAVDNSLSFGKLVGLDPATPCFVSREHGISSDKLARAVRQVLVVHSNAGFAGVPSERAHSEIVLNGGTFQPGCAWYDFACHHARSTDILSRHDDECQMIAYRCTSYHHFKLGACETCGQPDEQVAAAAHAAPAGAAAEAAAAAAAAAAAEDEDEQRGSEPAGPARQPGNCVLVNLPEQHRAARAVLDHAEQFDEQLRRLAGVRRRAPGRATIELFRRLEQLKDGARERSSRRPGRRALVGGDSSALPSAARAQYLFVSTNPNFRFGRKTHCLQHYQLRLLIYQGGIGSGGNNNNDKNSSSSSCCKLSSFYASSAEVQLKLYYESGPEYAAAAAAARQAKLVLDQADARQMASSVKLNPVIRDLFHTSLVNFEGGPRLFTGAQLVNVDWAGLRACLAREARARAGRGAGVREPPATTGPNFVLDVALMSNTNHKIRNAFSSVLCGQLDLGGRAAINMSDENNENNNNNNNNNNNESKDESDGPGPRPGEPAEQGDALTLNLCRRSELADVSGQIDRLLEHMRLHRLDETWKVSLLNSLFSLFTEWEPF